MSRRYIESRWGRLICDTKTKYWDKETAWGAARALRKQDGRNWRAYKCAGQRGQPRHWHLTSGRNW